MELQERVEVQRRGRGSGLVTADRGGPGEQEERGLRSLLGFPVVGYPASPAGSQKVCTDCYPLPHVLDFGKPCVAIY